MSVPLTPAVLLEHRDFVRDLAASLLRDPHAAEDVAQDTLLSLLRRPPQAIRSLRALLAAATHNAVRNRRREESRRARRERSVAANRMAGEDLAGRLQDSQAIVAAVLALQPEMRDAVLLRHYEGLSTTEIARRLGVPEGTIRARLFRAHRELRDRLEAEFGDRRLNAVLAGVAAPAAVVKGGAVVAIAAAVMLATATAVLVFRSDKPIDRAQPQVAQAAVVAAPAEPPTATAPIVEPPQRVAAGAGPDSEKPIALDTAPLSDVRTAVLQAQALLRERLFEVPEHLRDAYTGEDGGVVRLIERSIKSGENSLLGDLESGAYFSFVAKTHCYQEEPDIELQVGKLSSGFAGRNIGFFVAIGDVALADVPANGAVSSQLLATGDARLLETMFADSGCAERGQMSNDFYDAMQGESDARRVDVTPRRTWLVRSVFEHGHDVLAAVRCLEIDDMGATFAWRVLQQFPMKRRFQPGRCPRHESLPPTPRWLAELDTPDLIAWLRSARETATQRFLVAPPWPDGKGDAGAKTARLYFREHLDDVLNERGGGAYFSFATEKHSYNEEPDLELQREHTSRNVNGRHESTGFDDHLSSGFYGGTQGYVVDLGELALERAATASPDELADTQELVAALRILESVGSAPDADAKDGRARELGRIARGQGIEIPDDPLALVGHSYWLRAILPGEHDHLVAFTVLARDDDGIVIAYRIRKTFPKPGR